MKVPTMSRIAVALMLAISGMLFSGMLFFEVARAQDVPGIEICTVEKTMERRTSCLQSNVDFLQKTIAKLTADHQQKLDAANRQIDGLKMTVTGLQKIVDDLQKKAAADTAKKDTPATAAPAKDAAKETSKETSKETPKDAPPAKGSAK
jgi:esterase/lipase